MKLIKIDKNGTKHFECLVVCDRCGGSGIFYVAVHNGHGVPAQPDGGVCYKCGGAGKVLAIIKEYTPEHEAILAQRREARANKKAADLAARRITERAANCAKWLADHGFNGDGRTQVFLGDTYAAKDQLKAGGAVFDGTLGWHAAEPIEGFEAIKIHITEIAELNDWGRYELQDPRLIKALIKERTPKGPESSFIGAVGEKLQLKVTIERSFGFDSKFGYTYIHKFRSESGDVLVWKTGSSLEQNHGQAILKGTVKAHTEYQGEKQTELTRCKLEEVRTYANNHR